MAEVVEDHTAILAYLGNASLRWNAFTDLGTNVVITYSFLETDELPPGSEGYYGVDSFASFTEFQRDAMRSVVEEAGKVAGIVFVEVEEGRSMINMYSGLDGDGGGVSASGYADYGSASLNWTSQSDLVMIYQDFTPGTFTYGVLLHELGHSLGLSHTHQGDYVLTEETDYNYNSVMTYTNTWDHAEEYGHFDVDALSHLYGDAASSDGFTASVTDSGMIVVRASDRSDSLIAAASGSKLVGMKGKDDLFGREGDDVLHGNRGHDALQGGYGEDRLIGHNGDDKMVGDVGLSYAGDDDYLAGGAGWDVINGNGGNDHLIGNNGKDILIGEYGDDRIAGGKGHDKITGGSGDDRMTGGFGRDAFIFSNQDNGDTDTITDFTAVDDRLNFIDMAFLDAESLTVTQIGDDTELYASGYNFRLLLEYFDSNDLNYDNIYFA